MKRLNLIPKKTKPGQVFPAGAATAAKRPVLKVILVLGVIIAALVAVPNLLMQRDSAKIAAAKKDIEAAKTELGHLLTKQTNLAKDYDSLLKKKATVDAKLEYLKSAKVDKPGELSQALVYLPTLIPDEIWINKMSVGNQGVVINGSTLNNQAVARFMDNLNNSNKFKSSSFNFTKKNEIGDATLYNFEIATNLVN